MSLPPCQVVFGASARGTRRPGENSRGRTGATGARPLVARATGARPLVALSSAAAPVQRERLALGAEPLALAARDAGAGSARAEAVQAGARQRVARAGVAR